MQFEFMGGPEYNIEDKIKDLMKQNDKISIAVAFLGNSGVSTIKQSIIEFKKNNGSITLLTGIDFSITDPEALQELLNLDVNCNIIYEKNFHPKLYIFERNGKGATVIIGSSNLSKGGLSTNYEANLLLKGETSEATIELNEYLYQKSQKDSFLKLSESDYKELSFAEKKSDEGWTLYQKGNLNDAYNLLIESYDIYQKLEKKYDYIIA